MARRRDPLTLDLFSNLRPAPVVARFDEGEVRAGTLSGRLSRAVAACLKECGMSRDVVARQMGDFLQEEVPPSMLDAYASQAKQNHQISATRLVALAMVTGDARPLNALLGEADLVAVPLRFEALLKRERAKEMREDLDREIQAADAEWRAKR